MHDGVPPPLDCRLWVKILLIREHLFLGFNSIWVSAMGGGTLFAIIKIQEGNKMIFLLQEEIDDFNTFKTWFINEAIPQIEALGGKCLVMGVEVENEKKLHLVMETPSVEIVQGFMGSEEFTEARKSAGVHVDTTQITFLKDYAVVMMSQLNKI